MKSNSVLLPVKGRILKPRPDNGGYMNIVYVFDKAKADYLHSLGFIYNEKEIDNKKAYQFFGTDEFMKSLTSNYEQSDFLVSKNMCF